jgi:hypothetical protein
MWVMPQRGSLFVAPDKVEDFVGGICGFLSMRHVNILLNEDNIHGAAAPNPNQSASLRAKKYKGSI